MTKGVLDGIKVISMGSAWAGPYVGRVLAEMGAEVFRIAFPGRQWAIGGSPEIEEKWKKKLMSLGLSEDEAAKCIIRDPGYVGNYHPNNYGIGLDLRNEQGKEIYKHLVKLTDIIVDGWSPRVMSNLGLGYDVLKEIKPDIIYASIPAMGMTGSEKDVRMWGTGCEFLGGLTSIRGYQDGPPHRASGFITDGISSPHIILAIMAALNYRSVTGKGQQIDVSQTECATSTLAEAIMDYNMNQRIAKPTGNRHNAYAPHNAYRCKGEDKWITIAVTSEEEWEGLCAAMDYPEWTEDTEFADAISRWRSQEALDGLIEQWTSQHDHYALQDILQSFGVPAAAVVDLNEHILFDPHVKDRDIYTWLTYHDGVADPVFRVPWVLPNNPTQLKWCGPYTGQHNDYLLKDVLGMSDEQVKKLADDNIIGATPPQS